MVAVGCLGGQAGWRGGFRGNGVHGLVSLEKAVSDDDKVQEVTLPMGDW